jgi:hypothetical protein
LVGNIIVRRREGTEYLMVSNGDLEVVLVMICWDIGLEYMESFSI